MKKIFKLYLLINLFCTLVYTQNIGAYLGAPPSSSITSKKGDFSFNINYTTLYSFDQKLDINHYNRLALNVPIAGIYEFLSNVPFKGKGDIFELALSTTVGEDNNYSEMIGLNYNFKKRKFGISLHISSHNIVLDDIPAYSPMEYGISTHFRFRKKDIKPFFYYSYTQFDVDRNPHHTLILGALSRVNNISIGTHLVSSLEDVIDGANQYSYLSITIGFVID